MPNKRAYTDQQLLDNALLFQNYTSWEMAGLRERAEGTPSHHHAAKKLGPAFVARCTTHMVRAPKPQPASRTDDELQASAAQHKTPGAWKNGDDGAYQCALYQRNKKGREDFWKSITAHMVPAANPYSGAYFIYACVFPSSVYVGLSCRHEDMRRAEHGIRGPVFEHAQSGALWEWLILERGVADPLAAKEAERRWYDSYVARGTQMLNRAPTGGLGSIASTRIDKEAIRQRFLDYDTRKALLVADQSAYRIAKRNGWYDEFCAHMRPISETKSEAHTGKKRSVEAKEKMRAAKLGGTLTAEHKAKISTSLERAYSDGRRSILT